MPSLLCAFGVLAHFLLLSSADLNGRMVFPPDNPWNTDISNSPVDPNSATLIASIGLTSPLHPDFGTVYNGAPNGIPYNLVSASQAKVPVVFQIVDESDPGPYPIPANASIEGGPTGTGDRHVIVVDTDNWMLYELDEAYEKKGGAQWNAYSGAIFNMSSDALRPLCWTSADAAGASLSLSPISLFLSLPLFLIQPLFLTCFPVFPPHALLLPYLPAGLPIFPGLVRYDEVVTGTIDHALRFTAPSTRKAFVNPARHYASSQTSSSLPPMGMRVRLKSSYDISSFSKTNQVILTALKKYGMFLADNGSSWFLSGAPDMSWNDDDLHQLTRVQGQNFEVVLMSQPYTNC